jgi:hypothetical protein
VPSILPWSDKYFVKHGDNSSDDGVR